jgi:hypothetical protein
MPKMAGKVVMEPQAPPHFTQSLGVPQHADAESLLRIMAIIHQEPLATAFADLQTGRVNEADGLKLAHLFEEVGALAIHQLINRELLFDAYSFDSYWKTLGPVVSKARQKSGNPKFGENFELMAEMATDYRDLRPAKKLPG